MARVLAAALTTLVLGLLLVPVVRALARRVGMVAAPRKDRWHSQPTALLGGVGIFAAFAIGVAIFHDDLGEGLPILAASAFLFVVGLIDDVVQIRPLTKLVAQIVAAGGIVASGLVLPWTHEPVIDAALAMLWIVGITNAVNLLDNMDGLAAGIAAIGCVFLGITFATNGQWDMAVLPALLAGAALGFLAYNFKPASIFMGDSGSMFLGCLLGGMALLSSYGRSRSVASVLLTPVLIMMIPILDTTLVAITRRLRGQPVSVGGRDHTSHRLVALGASERRAVVILYVVAAASGAVAVVVRELRADALLAVIPTFAMLMLFFALYIGMVPVRGIGGTAIRAATATLGSPRPLVAAAIDILLSASAYVSAFAIRWDWELPDDQLSILASTLPFVALGEPAVMYVAGLYRARWHVPSIDALAVMARAGSVAGVLTAILVSALYGFSGPSRGALVLNGLLLVLLIGGSRVSVLLLQRLIRGDDPIGPARHAVVYGVGALSAAVVQEVQDNPLLGLHVVGFLDESSSTEARHGLPVFGREDVRSLVSRCGLREVIFSSKPRPDLELELASMGLRLRSVHVEIR